MEEFIKAIQASTVSADTYSRILAAAATELADTTPVSLGNDMDWDEFRADCVRSAKSKPKIVETTYDNYMKTTIDPDTIYFITDGPLKYVSDKSEPQTRLTPALCSCCGGRIGRDNYYEYCGTRYW